jgi:hypothetical protein
LFGEGQPLWSESGKHVLFHTRQQPLDSVGTTAQTSAKARRKTALAITATLAFINSHPFHQF